MDALILKQVGGDAEAGSSSSSGGCAPCGASTVGILTNVRAALSKLEKRIRTSVSVVAVFAILVVATCCIAGYFVYSLYHMIIQWKTMADNADPPLASTGTSDALASVTGDTLGDDEVYLEDLRASYDSSGRMTAGDKIVAGVQSLEQKYDAYNKQIKEYSQTILKKAPDDIFDKDVLDSAKDDFH